MEDPVQVDLAVIALLRLQVPCLQHPEGKLRVEVTEVVTIWPLAVVQAGRRKELRKLCLSKSIVGQNMSISNHICKHRLVRFCLYTSNIVRLHSSISPTF